MHIFCIWGTRLKRVPPGEGSEVIKFEPQHFPILWSQLDLKTLKNQFQHENPTGIHVDPHYTYNLKNTEILFCIPLLSSKLYKDSTSS